MLGFQTQRGVSTVNRRVVVLWFDRVLKSALL
jgi:hypothetical protein